MKITTIRLDEKTEDLLKQFCEKTNLTTSKAIRHIIQKIIPDYLEKGYLSIEKKFNSTGLTINEKRAIKASFETLFLVRELVDDPEVIEAAKNKSDENLMDGWCY